MVYRWTLNVCFKSTHLRLRLALSRGHFSQSDNGKRLTVHVFYYLWFFLGFSSPWSFSASRYFILPLRGVPQSGEGCSFDIDFSFVLTKPYTPYPKPDFLFLSAKAQIRARLANPAVPQAANPRCTVTRISVVLITLSDLYV